MSRSRVHRFVAVLLAVLAIAVSVPSLVAESGTDETTGAPDGQGRIASTAADVLSFVAGLDVDVVGFHVEHEVSRDLGDPRTTLVPDTGADVELSDVAPEDLPADLGVDASLARHRGATTVTDTGSVAVASAAPVTWVTPHAGLLAGATLAALAALTWVWPHLKKLAVLGLYAHIGRAEALENQVRERVFALIKAEPGIHASDLAAKAGVSWGTATYHLDVLSQCGMIVAHKDGRYRRYFANGCPGDKDVQSILRNARSAAVRDLVALRPGLSQRDLSEAAGMSPQALHWHLVRLERAGLVRREREGRIVRHFVSQGAA